VNIYKHVRKKVVSSYIKVLYQDYSGDTEENHDNFIKLVCRRDVRNSKRVFCTHTES
jgi:hypothetical protein